VAKETACSEKNISPKCTVHSRRGQYTRVGWRRLLYFLCRI